ARGGNGGGGGGSGEEEEEDEMVKFEDPVLGRVGGGGLEDRWTDVTFVLEDGRVEAHSVLLHARCPFFAKLLAFASADAPPFTAKHTTTETGGTAYEITAEGYQCASLSLILDLLYTTKYKPPWDHRVLLPSRNTKDGIYRIYEEFTSLIKILDLDIAKLSSEPLYNHNFASLIFNIERPDGSFKSLPHADVTTLLENSTTLQAHSTILSHRSPFFSAMLGPGARWNLTHTPTGQTLINLSHIPSASFLIVLKFLYGRDDPDELLTDLKAATIEEWIEGVIAVLAVGDEMMVEGVREACERALVGRVELGNVGVLLGVGEMFELRGLVAGCLEFCECLVFALQQACGLFADCSFRSMPYFTHTIRNACVGRSDAGTHHAFGRTSESYAETQIPIYAFRAIACQRDSWEGGGRS
ncbi:hypothetical protein HK097_006303, partial [Rhizophlyctis rosea]